MSDSYWNEVMYERGEAERLHRLPERAQMRFAAACVDRVLCNNYAMLAQRIPSNELSLVRSAHEMVWAGADLAGSARVDPSAAQETIQRIGALLPDAEDDDPYSDLPEWRNGILAIIFAIRGLAGDDLTGNVEGAAGASYQPAADRAVREYFQRTGATSLGGDAIAAVQSKSPACQAEIAFQLDCIRRLERGEPVLRQDGKTDGKTGHLPCP